MAHIVSVLIKLLLIFSCSSRPERRHTVSENPPKYEQAPPHKLKRQHPLQDMFGDDNNKQQIPEYDFDDIHLGPPEFQTLDPHNIINKNDYENNPFANPLEMHDYSTQHSFQHPLDMLSQNWVLIGDAVATTNFARLTPEDGGRRGVIWNKFGLHLKEWQILIEFNIHSSNAMGGDGFGIWLLDEHEIKRPFKSDLSEAHSLLDKAEYDLLLGDLYGIRPDFNGTGIIFDTFDNDNNGDNPLVFSVVNDGKHRRWTMQNDLGKERDKVKEDLPNRFRKELFPTECTLDYEGKESVLVMIRYQNGQLHVYTDLEHKNVKGDESEIKRVLRRHHASPFGGLPIPQMLGKIGIMPMPGDKEVPHLCLVRTIDVGLWKNPHIAISAITGDLSDSHDILKLETKYIRKEHVIKDGKLPATGYRKRSVGILWTVYWSVICILSLALIGENVMEIMLIRSIYKKQTNIAQTISTINPYLICSYFLNLIQYILLIFAFNWKCLLVNAPLLVIRLQKFMVSEVALTSYGFELRTFFAGTNYRQWLMIRLIFLSVSGFYHVWRLFHI